MPSVVIDARDAVGTQLRGWGRYTAELVRALLAEPDLGLDLAPVLGRPRWPEIVFEQLVLPRSLRRRRAALVHVPNCFLPLRRSCPGVVTIHDLAFETWPQDFALATRTKYRGITPRAARSAERVICPSAFTAGDLSRRYAIDPAKVRVIPEAPALPINDRPPAAEARDPYILAVGDLRPKKNLAALVNAYVVIRRRCAIPHRLVLAGIDAGEGPRLRALAAG
jgi:glycosyltransferase involved in cell wall biosynthesis